jgi:hypothetical protein
MFRTTQVQLRAALALSGWVALAVTLLPGGALLRWAPVLLFVTFGPGLAVLHPRPRPRPRQGTGEPGPGTRLETLALAAPLSWSLATLAATALFLVQGFSATVFLVSLAAFCTVVALLPGMPLPTAMRRPDHEAAEEAAPDATAIRSGAEPPPPGAVKTSAPETGSLSGKGFAPETGAGSESGPAPETGSDSGIRSVPETGAGGEP